MKKYYLIGLFIFLVSLFLGYAAGRGYKTYEINMEKKFSSESNKNLSNLGEPAGKMKEVVNPNVYAPKILKLSSEKDLYSGQNLKIDLAHMRFAPELLGKEVTQNAGHAYVYVNGVAVGRAYSNWYHIPENFFRPGTNTVSVTLNANNSNVWWSKKGTLEARTSIEVVR